MVPSTENGFTLVELMIALLIMTVGIIGAAKLQHGAFNNYIKTTDSDQAINLLASYWEELNAAEIGEILPGDNQPASLDILIQGVMQSFSYDQGLVFSTDTGVSGIRVYRIVVDSWLENKNGQFIDQNGQILNNDDSTIPNRILNYRTVYLCTAWKPKNERPRIITRTLVKPIASDS